MSSVTQHQPATETVCYRHPDRPTGLACTSCGRPICSRCSTEAPVGQRCPECLRRQGRQRIIHGRALTGAPSFRTAPVTFTFIGLAVAFFVFGWLGDLELVREVEGRLVMWNRAIVAGQWWRMLTVVLLHAGIMHIAFNMYALYALGPQIEREVGGLRFASLYLSSAAAGSAFAFHLGGLDDVGVGASGAIFGLFGIWLASAVLRRRTRAGRYLLNQLGLLLVINAAIPLFIPSVSWQAHLGGLLAGFVVGLAWSRLPAGSKLAQLAITAAILLASILSTQL